MDSASKEEIRRAHNSANDAHATLCVAIAQILDKSLYVAPDAYYVRSTLKLMEERCATHTPLC